MKTLTLNDYHRLCTLCAMLSLELKGMKRSRPPSTYKLLKQMLELKGTRQAVYTRAREEQARLRNILERRAYTITPAGQQALALDSENRRATATKEVQS